jgi:hypothetical protein
MQQPLPSPTGLGRMVWLILATAGTAAAAPGVTVQGVVTRPAKVEPPAPRFLGFLPRLENPIVELRQYDPLPECFVYLEAEAPPAEAEPPSRATVVWQLESHSFNPPILPAITGGSVEIANVGRETHILVAPDREDLLPRDPIGPGSSRTFVVPKSGGAVRIVSRASPHLEGRLVPLPTEHHGRVDRSGRFRIDNVAPGRYSVRVWFRDGWADLPERTIDAPAKDVRIDLTTQALKARGSAAETR